MQQLPAAIYSAFAVDNEIEFYFLHIYIATLPVI